MKSEEQVKVEYKRNKRMRYLMLIPLILGWLTMVFSSFLENNQFYSIDKGVRTLFSLLCIFVPLILSMQLSKCPNCKKNPRGKHWDISKCGNCGVELE